MGKIKFYDTNAMLHNVQELKNEDLFYVSSISLKELENIKTSSKKDDEVKFKARQVTRFLRDNEEKYICFAPSNDVFKLLEEMNLENNNDNLIMATAYIINQDEDIIFITNDICCFNIAKNIFNLETQENLNKVNNNYKGYIELKLNTEQINDLFTKYNNFNENPLNLIENQYLIIQNIDLNSVNEFKYSKGQLLDLKLPSSKAVKGINSKQRCALDLLYNAEIPIKIIAGSYGSGKTLLSVRTAIHTVLDKGYYSKITLVRNPLGSGQDIGFLPGSKEEKIKDFYKPIEQNLEGGEFQLNNMIMKGQLEMEIPYYMKGMSLNHTFILVDECEDLDTKIFKLIGTRVGKESCIAYVGDWKQAESKFIHNNGLSKFIDYAKGNPLVGIVVLDEDVRSNASKVFANFE